MTEEIIGFDMDGIALRDGDAVVSYNLMAKDEKYPLTAPKQAVPARIFKAKGMAGNDMLFIVSQDDGTTGCDPSDAWYGVRRSDHALVSDETLQKARSRRF